MRSERIKEGLKRSISPIKDAAQKRPHIELDGKREVIVSGCTKISEYSSETVLLRCFSMELKVSGKGLELVLLSGKVIAIRGSISGLELL